jgi:hypothetical protein
MFALLFNNSEEFLENCTLSFVNHLHIQHLRVSLIIRKPTAASKFNDILVQMLGQLSGADKQNERDTYLNDTLLSRRPHVTRTHGRSPFFMTYSFEPVLPRQPVVETVRAPLTEPKVKGLQPCQPEHVQNLDRLRTEANAPVLRHQRYHKALRRKPPDEVASALERIVHYTPPARLKPVPIAYPQQIHPLPPRQRQTPQPF